MFAPMAAKKKVEEDFGPATQLPPPGDPNTLYILDISGYIFRAYHALPPLSTSKGEATHAVRGVTSMLLRLIKDRQPAMVAVATDAKGGSFRNDVYPKYKANRPPPPPDLSGQISRVMEIVDAMGMARLGETGFEADDVIATVCKEARDQGWGVVIVSADKDLLQLVGGPVIMYDSQRNKVFGIPETQAKFGVKPEKVRDLLALMGDTSDNVPGVPSIGQKSAAKLLTEYGDFDGIYANVESISRKGWKSKLIEFEDQARLSRELVSLRNDMDLNLAEDHLQYTGGDPSALRQLFVDLEFTSMIAQLDPAPIARGNYRVVTDLADLKDIAQHIRRSGRFALRSVLSDDDALHADLVGLALSWGEGIGVYVPFEHTGVTNLSFADAAPVLWPLLSNSLLRKSTDDLKREALIWGRMGVRLRGGEFDLGLASYLYDAGRHGHSLSAIAQAELGADLGTVAALRGSGRKKKAVADLDLAELGDLAAAQADYTLRLASVLRPRMAEGDFAHLYRDLELPLVMVLGEMERTGVRIDAELLRAMGAGAEKDMIALEAKAYQAAGGEFKITSPRALEKVLFDDLGLPAGKKTSTGARSTSQAILEGLLDKHPLPGLILEHRSLAKLKNTYLDALPDAVDPKTGRIHTRYNQTVAQTGRLSSSNPNLQNIPIRTELGRRIRDAFIPADGFELMAADYSQIELRVLAHLSQDPELIDAYSKGDDVHVRTATALFDVAAENVTREQRAQAKTVNFAVIYGQTQWALAQNLDISKTEAQRYIDAFFERYQGVTAYMDRIAEEARATGYAHTMLGRRRPVADLRHRNPHLRNAAERIARNTPIQGSAADIIKIAMVRVGQLLEERRSRMILTVHDELVFELDPAEKEELVPTIVDTMQGVQELSVPLIVEVGYGPSWGAAH